MTVPLNYEKKLIRSSFLDMPSLKSAVENIEDLEIKKLHITEDPKELELGVTVYNSFGESKVLEILENKYAFNIKIFKGDTKVEEEHFTTLYPNEIYQENDNYI